MAGLKLGHQLSSGQKEKGIFIHFPYITTGKSYSVPLCVEGVVSAVVVLSTTVCPHLPGAERGAVSLFAAAASETQKQYGGIAIRIRSTSEWKKIPKDSSLSQIEIYSSLSQNKSGGRSRKHRAAPQIHQESRLSEVLCSTIHIMTLVLMTQHCGWRPGGHICVPGQLAT